MQTQVNSTDIELQKDLDQFFYQANEYLQKYDAWKSTPADNPQNQNFFLISIKTDLAKPFDDAREKLSKYYRSSLSQVDPVGQLCSS
jgi:hypothetical protein